MRACRGRRDARRSRGLGPGRVDRRTASRTAAAGAPPPGAPIMPLRDVRRGMRCTGYSVIKGTAISSFDVEILDVLTAGTSSAAASCSRARAARRSPRADRRGLLGLARRVPRRDRHARGSPARSPSGRRVRQRRGPRDADRGGARRPRAPAAAAPARAPRCSGRPGRSPRRSPSPGSSPRIGAALERTAPAHGRTLHTLARAPPGAAPRAGLPAPEPAPRIAAAVGLASGDIAIGGVGTVTYRRGADVWLSATRSTAPAGAALLLQDAYVATVVANPTGCRASSYKLASPATTSGPSQRRDPGGRRPDRRLPPRPAWRPRHRSRPRRHPHGRCPGGRRDQRGPAARVQPSSG